MRTEIEVYLGDEQLEFSEPLDILFNYKITDNTNPTAIRNSFSKGIKIAGTPKNNDIFGHIWDLSRIQGYEGNIKTGFNPLKKTPFTIYVDGNIYESGYAKLDSINRKNNQIYYNLTLFGGIGELFYSLTYKDEDGNEKKTLADLQYEERGDDDSLTEVIDMDFTINKETIWDAWQQIMGESSAVYDDLEVDRPNNYLYQNKWKFINFMPAYEGIPENFSPNKVLMNQRNNIAYIWSDSGFTTVDGFALGESDEDLTYNETKDYRSYLQRPVIKMQEIIKACQNPINNGGWELRLDETFFNDNNPYWNDTWLTLDKLQNVKEGGEITTVTEVEIGSKKGNYYDLSVDVDSLSEFTNINLGIGIEWTNTTTTTANNLYLSYQYDGAGGGGMFEEVCRWYKYNGAILLQIVGYNAVDEVIATSNVNYLYSPNSNLGTDWGSFKGSFMSDKVPVPSVIYHSGRFIKDGNKYIWADDSGKPTAINFRFTEKSNISKLRLKVMNPYTVSYKYYDGIFSPSNKTSYNGYNQPYLFTTPFINSSRQDDVDEAFKRGGLIYGNQKPFMVDANLEVQDYAELFSGTKIRKVDYLTTENTACDYLIAYAKMFGLYFWRDFNATPKDDSYNKGVIYLLTRNSFYDKENIIDIQDIVDRSRDMVITPSTADSKWLMFNTEQIESEAEEEYVSEFGSEYGSQRINTGFNFNGETKDLLDKVIFKGGVEVLETDKYYAYVSWDKAPYTYNGFRYNLYKKNNENKYDVKVIEVPVEMIPTNPINKNGWERTDVFPKLQFHTTENDPIDGKDVLVFFKGSSHKEEVADNRNEYWISDDLPQMAGFNDGSACWLMTWSEEDMMGNKIAYKLNGIPMFGRNLIGYGGVITHTLDMGNPKMTFIRDTYNSPQMSIYAKCWKSFIEDMYDDDNRLLSCYVRFDNKPVSSQLRNLYWFDNSIWRLNTIKDWNITEIEPIKCEFVKIMDLNNYHTTPINYDAYLSLTFPALKEVDYKQDENGAVNIYYEIGDEEQTIYGKLETTDTWSFYDTIPMEYEDGTYDGLTTDEVMTPSNTYGSGDTIKEFKIPANTSRMYRDIKIQVEGTTETYRSKCIIRQAASTAKSIVLTPSSLPPFSAAGGGRTIKVVFNNREGNEIPLISYLNNSSAWITATWGVWTDNEATLTISISSNSGYEREGGIVLTSIDGTVKRTLSITQSSNIVESFNVEPKIINMDAAGGFATITVDGNMDSWEIKGYPEWVQIIDVSSNNFTISVEPNRDDNRDGLIDVAGYFGEDSSTELIQITQSRDFDIIG